jgi:predicted RNA binding protein YcfA (HicA-like mRNA interferase family)
MPHDWNPKPFADVKKDLEDARFKMVPAKDRGKGSHRIFKRVEVRDGKRVTTSVSVPDHGKTPVSAGVMRNIAKRAGLTPAELFGEKPKGRRELTPNEVNAGVADAAGAVDPTRRTQRSSGRRGAKQTGRNREERSPRGG